MWAFVTFKSSSVPYGKAIFFLQNNHRFFLTWLSAPLTLLAVGFFLIVKKSDTDRSRAFLSPQITRERCGTRFVDKLELSARRTSIVISIASVHSLAQYSRAVVRTHGRVCGYMWIYSVRTESTSECRQQNRKHAAWRDQTSNQSQHYCRRGK